MTTSLHTAALSNQLAVVEEIVRADATLVHAQDAQGWTPLHCAVHGGGVDTVKFLLKNGSDVNALTKGGASVLHLVCGMLPMGVKLEGMISSATVLKNDTRVKLMRLLLYKGANAGVVTQDGEENVLHVLARLTDDERSAEAVLMVVGKTGDPHVVLMQTSGEGYTAQELCEEHGHLRVAFVLCGGRADELSAQMTKRDLNIKLRMLKLGTGEGGNTLEYFEQRWTRAHAEPPALRSLTAIKCGWMTKRGSRRRNWRKRWFVLEPLILYYYASDTSEHGMKGALLLAGCRVDHYHKFQGRTNVIRVLSRYPRRPGWEADDTRELLFAAETEEDALLWAAALQSQSILAQQELNARALVPAIFSLRQPGPEGGLDPVQVNAFAYSATGRGAEASSALSDYIVLQLSGQQSLLVRVPEIENHVVRNAPPPRVVQASGSGFMRAGATTSGFFSAHSHHSSMSRRVRCPKCEGLGSLGVFGPCSSDNLHFQQHCSACSGTGMTPKVLRLCPKCKGLGGFDQNNRPTELRSPKLAKGCGACKTIGFFNAARVPCLDCGTSGTVADSAVICSGCNGRCYVSRMKKKSNLI